MSNISPWVLKMFLFWNLLKKIVHTAQFFKMFRGKLASGRIKQTFVTLHFQEKLLLVLENSWKNEFLEFLYIL